MEKKVSDLIKKVVCNIGKAVVPIALIGTIAGCTGSRYTSDKEFLNTLNEKEIKITREALRETDEEFYKLENEFYDALSLDNSSNFDSLQTKYHSLKSEREKYKTLLELNGAKK